MGANFEDSVLVFFDPGRLDEKFDAEVTSENPFVTPHSEVESPNAVTAGRWRDDFQYLTSQAQGWIRFAMPVPWLAAPLLLMPVAAAFSERQLKTTEISNQNQVGKTTTTTN